MAFVPGQEGKRVRKGRGGQDQGLTESGMLTLQIPAHLPHQPRLPAQGGAPEAKSPLEEFHRGQSARASSPVCSVSDQRRPGSRVPDWQADADLEGANCGSLLGSPRLAGGPQVFLKGDPSNGSVAITLISILITRGPALKIARDPEPAHHRTQHQVPSAPRTQHQGTSCDQSWVVMVLRPLVFII